MELKDWIGRSESVDDVITPTPAAAMAATLDQDPARPSAGTPLPPLALAFDWPLVAVALASLAVGSTVAAGAAVRRLR